MFSEQIQLKDNPLSRAERDQSGEGNRMSLRFFRPGRLLPEGWRCVMSGSYRYGHRAPYNFVCSFGDFDGGNAVQKEHRGAALTAYRIQFYGAWEAWHWPAFLDEDKLEIVREYDHPDMLTLFLKVGFNPTKQQGLFT
jgi:hypothetical protein